MRPQHAQTYRFVTKHIFSCKNVRYLQFLKEQHTECCSELFFFLGRFYAAANFIEKFKY